jgi:hypothetical protein
MDKKNGIHIYITLCCETTYEYKFWWDQTPVTAKDYLRLRRKKMSHNKLTPTF